MERYQTIRSNRRFYGSVLIGAVSLIVLGAASPGGAAVLEVPLSELHGFYADGPPPVTTQFSLAIDPAAILSASIRLHGNLPWPSYMNCGGYNGIIFTLQMPAATGTWDVQFYVDQRVNFQRVYPFQSVDGATWDFLADGSGSVSCAGVARPLPPGCGYIHGGCCPIGEVTYASLLFEYDPSVPVEITTWGRIKALYQ